MSLGDQAGEWKLAPNKSPVHFICIGYIKSDSKSLSILSFLFHPMETPNAWRRREYINKRICGERSERGRTGNASQAKNSGYIPLELLLQCTAFTTSTMLRVDLDSEYNLTAFSSVAVYTVGECLNVKEATLFSQRSRVQNTAATR